MLHLKATPFRRQHHGVKRRLGARAFAASGARLALGAALLTGLAGCGVLQLPQPAPVRPASGAVQGRAKVSKGYTSLAQALGGLDAKKIRAYVDRFSKPKTQRLAADVPEVYIDVDAMARRHPAWRLADALQRGVTAPVAPQPGLNTIAVSNSASAQTVTPEIARELFRVAPPRGVTAPGDTGATNRGRQGLDAFLNAWNQRQAQARRDDAFLARRSLEDEIAIAIRGTVDPITLKAISAQTALELSNLRLKLIANLPTPLDQRAATQARIAEIEAQLQAIWKAQADEQEARIREAFQDTPARLRREGEARLGAAQREREAQDRLARLALLRDVESTLPNDSNSGRSTGLRLVLPSTRVPLASPRSRDAAPSSEVTPRLRALPDVSVAALNLPQVLAPAAVAVAQQRIAQLRAIARQEARSWAKRSAASEGARWTSSPLAPNHTAQALKLLKG